MVITFHIFLLFLILYTIFLYTDMFKNRPLLARVSKVSWLFTLHLFAYHAAAKKTVF